MSDFRQLTADFWASPQISIEDVDHAAQLGVTLIINNRPDGEAADQPDGAAIEKAAKAAGISYCAIPVTHAGFNEGQLDELRKALENESGKVLAYCRSGTRSTLLWSLTQASLGADVEELAQTALAAGYDVSAIRPSLDLLAARA